MYLEDNWNSVKMKETENKTWVLAEEAFQIFSMIGIATLMSSF